MWHIILEDEAIKALKKIDKQARSKIISYLNTRVIMDPKACGKPLTGNLSKKCVNHMPTVS